MSFGSDDDFEIIVNDLSDDYLLAISLQALEEELNSEENKNRESYVKSDYELAVALSQIDGQTPEEALKLKTKIKAKDVVSPQLELTDPSPNIWHLMRDFDQLFFGGVLAKHCIELSWSSKMTRTAGLCAWSPTTNYCSIRLSLPLLQLRSRKDLVETLIHEMIHALLFVTREDDNHESHGNKFHEHMYRINRESGANITVYHNFHEEVNHYLTHIWRCDGKCRIRPPYFGYVRRAMNRKPGPNDYWFKFHEQSCGGTFIKESEPTKDVKKSEGKQVMTPEKLHNKDIRTYFTPTQSVSQSTSSQIIPFSGNGFKLGSKESNKNITKSDSKLDSICDKSISNNVKTIENYFKSDSNNSLTEKEIKSSESFPNIKTSKTLTKTQTNDKPIEAFSGKGYVLGRLKTESPIRPSKSKPIVITLDSDSMVSAPKKTKPKENIEIIEID